uniref:Uncharacterized protein n=1 Tax=Acrobeloides nanus TaxID=290746 RepID=A0A914EHR5_9BILA
MSDNNQSNGMILDVSNAYENEYDRMESTVNTNGDVEKSDYPNENAFAKDDDSNSSIEEDLNLDETPLTPIDKDTIPVMAKCTPAVVKVRQTRQMFQVQSPSDAIMSPCTKKLNTHGVQMPRRPASSNPASVLRFKQQNAIKLNLEDVDSAEKVDEETDISDK